MRLFFDSVTPRSPARRKAVRLACRLARAEWGTALRNSAIAGLALIAAGTAFAAAPGSTPELTGVRVEKPAGDGVHYSQGSGVMIGGGLVLSAAHVFKFNPEDPKVTVLMAGWRVQGTVVSQGDPGAADLALVKVEHTAIPAELRDLPPVPVCTQDAVVDQPLAVAAAGQTAPAKAVGMPGRRGADHGATNALTPAYHNGASGGGVFDAKEGCLAGIIVQEVSGYTAPDTPFVDVTVFVPASGIAAFLAKYRAAHP
jgi:hypothetical protein